MRHKILSSSSQLLQVLSNALIKTKELVTSLSRCFLFLLYINTTTYEPTVCALWTYSWLIWFLDTAASSLKYGTIFAPQQEQKLTADELSEPDTVPRVITPQEGESTGGAGRSVRCSWSERELLLLSHSHVLRHGETAKQVHVFRGGF